MKRKCKGRATSGQPQIPLNVLLHDVVRPSQTKCKDQKEEKMHSDTVGVHSEVTATLENEGSVAQPVTSKEKLLCRQNLPKKALGGWAARGGTAARRVKGDLQKRKPIPLQRRERGVLKWRYPCTLQKSSGRSLWIIHDRAMITLDQPWHRRKREKKRQRRSSGIRIALYPRGGCPQEREIGRPSNLGPTDMAVVQERRRAVLEEDS